MGFSQQDDVGASGHQWLWGLCSFILTQVLELAEPSVLLPFLLKKKKQFGQDIYIIFAGDVLLILL